MLKSSILGIIAVLVVPLGLTANGREKERRLKEAIHALNVEEVIALLKADDCLTKEKSEKLLKIADDTLEYYETKTAKKDAVATVAGVSFTAMGLGIIVKAWGTPRLFPQLQAGGFFSLVGLYFLKRGLSGVARASYIKKAEGIVDLLEKKCSFF